MGQIKLGESLRLQNTFLGWTIVGRVTQAVEWRTGIKTGSETQRITQRIERIWRHEEVQDGSSTKIWDKRLRELQFSQTHRRDYTGRPIVKF